MGRVELPELGLYSALAPADHGEPVGTIGIPVRDHMNAATATALVTSASASWVGPGQHVDFNIIQGGVLALQRNEIIARMRGEWVLMIDDDMVWQPGQIKTLIDHFEENDLDMLGGLCFRRSHPYQPTMFMRSQPNEGLYTFLEDWTPGEIVEVDATGMAFIVIRKRVVEKMVAHFENRPGWQMPPYSVRTQQPPPNLFRWEGQLGEDLRFCQEAKEAGCRVWIDTGVEVGHVAEVQIGSRDYLRAISERSPELELERRQVHGQMGLPTLSRQQALEKLSR